MSGPRQDIYRELCGVQAGIHQAARSVARKSYVQSAPHEIIIHLESLRDKIGECIEMLRAVDKAEAERPPQGEQTDFWGDPE